MRVYRRDYRPLHLSVPVLSFGTRGSEDFEVPFAPAPWLDDLGGHDIHLYTYGLMMIVGFFCAVYLAKFLANRSGLDGEVFVKVLP